ncbi:hypothetical protein VHP8226_02256 [Vibrio hippocampi]|uniref:MSHA biogenesis protein MshI n=2 Tax=Vibrio hippocampi TaxID=654686 RepID=A0ABM8ZJ69_9VIBR|nr:hypothetical protein VHP8226_02256 [Vibrio hippocampi]
MFKTLLARFNPKISAKTPYVVVIQSDSVYLSELGQSEVVRVDVTARNWALSVEQILKQIKESSRAIQIVLGSQMYQNYQIDTPKLPKPEWPQALPYLLREVISERVTDIVADAIELPSQNKTSAYVVKKVDVLSIASLIEKAGHTLHSIIPEEMIWGQALPDENNVVLLQRGRFENYRVSAFMEQRPIFQRMIRGVSGPVIKSDNLGLEVDSLALELQRSLDYLSSQFKTGGVHILRCCCDEEPEPELAKALSDRLSVQVIPLIEERTGGNGELLARLASGLSQSLDVNLYPAYLKPQKERFPLESMLALWGISAAILLAAYGYTHYQVTQLTPQLTLNSTRSEQLRNELIESQSALEKHKPSPVIVAAVARLKREIAATKEALHAVDEYDTGQQVGYSSLMKALAKLGRSDISLQSISLNQQHMDVSGLARSASVIPNWVSQFKSEPSLVGRTFESLKIGRNDQDIVTFELQTKPAMDGARSALDLNTIPNQAEPIADSSDRVEEE